MYYYVFCIGHKAFKYNEKNKNKTKLKKLQPTDGSYLDASISSSRNNCNRNNGKTEKQG